MNCDELRKDIAAIKSSRSIMQKKYDHMNKTGTSGKADFVESRIATEKLVDEILEKYLPDFAEKNPELFNWHPNQEIKLNERAVFSINNNGNERIIVGQPGCLVEISTTKNGQYKVNTFNAHEEWTYTPLLDVLTVFSKDKILLGDGLHKEINICEKDSMGKWNLTATIERLNNEEGDKCSPNVAIGLPNKRILIGGDNGMLNICGRDMLGRWKILEKIPGLKDKDGELSRVNAFHVLSDNNILIGGSRILYRLSRNTTTDKWVLSDESEKVFNDDDSHYVRDIKTMPNGNLLICTDEAIYEEKYTNEDEFERISAYKEGRHWGIIGANRYENFRKVLPVADNNIIVLLKNGARDTTSLYSFKKDDNGRWSITQELGYFDKETDEDGNTIADNRIEDIIASPNGGFIIAKRGSLVEYMHRADSVEELKNNLDKIIEKGEA